MWLAALCGLGGCFMLFRLAPRRVKVEGYSMAPTLLPGDKLLVVPVAHLRGGQILALADPRDTRRLLVKRLLHVTPLGLDVRGDNPPSSTDSRQLGLLSRSSVKGRVLWRYGPPERVGPPAGSGRSGAPRPSPVNGSPLGVYH